MFKEFIIIIIFETKIEAWTYLGLPTVHTQDRNAIIDGNSCSS